QVMDGGAVGRVGESRTDNLPEGALVQHMLGWRDVAQGPAKAFRRIQEVSDAIPSSFYLELLCMPGMTSYTLLTRLGAMQEGASVQNMLGWPAVAQGQAKAFRPKQEVSDDIPS